MSLIRLIPLQFARSDFLEKMLQPIAARFHCEVVLSQKRLDLNPFFNPVRSQYNANEIIQRILPPIGSGEKVVGITDLDLFIPVLSYIFGQAYLGGDAALVSGHRLDNARYGLREDPLLFQSRLLKCTLHELGHAAGLKHCLIPGCIMVSSTYVEEIDQKDELFCPACNQLLLDLLP